MKKLATLLLISFVTTGCTTLSNYMNPFHTPPTEEALKGERNDDALNGEKEKGQEARKALESLATYQRAHLPSPAKPVMYPAIVRLMWIPDHLNRYGDLIPAHYYYLKVLPERPAVTDAFELEAQLNATSKGAGSNVPYIYADERVRK